MNFLMTIINIFKNRPTDKTIRIARVLFGVLYIGIMYYNIFILNKSIDNQYIFGLVILNEIQVLILKYFMTFIGIIPIIAGASNICLLKKNYMRIVQIVFGFMIFYIAGSITESHDLDFDSLIGLFGIFPLFAGITGKCITSNCLKYKEKITKIRV